MDLTQVQKRCKQKDPAEQTERQRVGHRRNGKTAVGRHMDHAEQHEKQKSSENQRTRYAKRKSACHDDQVFVHQHTADMPLFQSEDPVQAELPLAASDQEVIDVHHETERKGGKYKESHRKDHDRALAGRVVLQRFGKAQARDQKKYARNDRRGDDLRQIGLAAASDICERKPEIKPFTQDPHPQAA